MRWILAIQWTKKDFLSKWVQLFITFSLSKSYFEIEHITTKLGEPAPRISTNLAEPRSLCHDSPTTIWSQQNPHLSKEHISSCAFITVQMSYFCWVHLQVPSNTPNNQGLDWILKQIMVWKKTKCGECWCPVTRFSGGTRMSMKW